MDTAFPPREIVHAVRRCDSEQHPSQFRAARADDSSEAHNFTGAQIEIDVVNARVFAAEAPDRKRDARRGGLGRRIEAGYFPSNH